MALTRALPVDRLLAWYNLAMAGTWLLALGRGAAAPWLLGAHLAAATLPLLLDRAGRLSPPVHALRLCYPLLWLAGFWTEVDAIRRALHPVANDLAVRALDHAVFGQSLHVTLMPAFPSLWVSEPLHFAYFMYYAGIGLPLIALWVQRRHDELAVAYFRLLLPYAVCFALFAIYPADGPQHIDPLYIGRPADGFWYRVVHAVNENGASLGAAFPSSHAAGAATIAYLGWLYFRRPVAVLMTLHATAVAIATFYSQYHYAIDSLAGIVLALLLQVWVVPLLLSRPARLAVPRLPVVPPVAWPVRQRGGVT